MQKIAKMLDTPITFFYESDVASKKQDGENGFALLQSKGAMRLLRAYAEISSNATKHALVMLADGLRNKDG